MPFLCLQLRRKAYLTAAVIPIRLPWRRELVKPGMVCSVAGWGHLGVNNPVAEKLQEVELEVQRDEECISRYKDYNTTTQICAGNPRKRKGSFLLRSPVLSMQSPRSQPSCEGPGQWELIISLCPQPFLLSSLCPVSLGAWRLSHHHIWAEASLGRRRGDCQGQAESSGPTAPDISQGPQQRPSTLGRHGGPHLKKVRLSPSSLCPQGASGDPLVCNGMAQGIVSFGEENGTPPNVYTRVSSFLYWIQKTMSYYKLQGAD